MHVISNKRLVAFSKTNPDSEVQLQTWRKLLESSSPQNFADLRRIFGSVDVVGKFHVFDIRGNKYRIVCGINFQAQRCFIKDVMTHAEYDRGKWK